MSYSRISCRLIVILIITFIYFLMEIFVGFTSKSLVMLGDSYRTLSDVLGLIVTLASVRMWTWKSPRNSYGWSRLSVWSSMTNCVFLLAVAFSVFVEALKKLAEPEKVTHPERLLVVAGIGLCLHLITLCLSSGNAQIHTPRSGSECVENSISEGSPNCDVRNRKNCSDLVQVGRLGVDEGKDETDNIIAAHGKVMPAVEPYEQWAQANTRGLFSYLLRNCVCSLAIIITATCVIFVDDSNSWKYQIDPIVSLFMVTVIVATTVAHIKEPAMILLQAMPADVHLRNLEEKLLTTVRGISSIHEFHIWQLTRNNVIASCHVRCQDLQRYAEITKQVKDLFRKEGIHSVVIQPEITAGTDMQEAANPCVLRCDPDGHCFMNTCCRNMAPHTTQVLKVSTHELNATSDSNPETKVKF